jgi:hypothetical protein
VFGDSFAGAYATGPAWTKMLGEKLEGALGRSVRVLNMARDGYGMPQIITLASGKLKELRPSLIVFAFNGPSLERARYWRTTVGTGDDMRLYASVENSPNPDPETAADAAIAMEIIGRAETRSDPAKDSDQASRDRPQERHSASQPFRPRGIVRLRHGSLSQRIPFAMACRPALDESAGNV